MTAAALAGRVAARRPRRGSSSPTRGPAARCSAPGRRRGRRRRLRPARLPGRLRRRARRGSSRLGRGEPRKPRLADYRVYGRFVRERHDDFAWENDRVAFRIYGQALETFEKEPLTSSTVDAWSKRTRRLVLNDWYLVDDYHRDHGEGGDFYSAGRTRGCGGSGLMVDGALAVSKNFRSSRVLASGPHPARLRARLPRVGEAGAEGDRGEARHPRRRQPLQPLRELLPRRRRRRRSPGPPASARPRASCRASTASAAIVRTWEHLTQLRRQRLARLRPS